jgi:hypothetical protein
MLTTARTITIPATCWPTLERRATEEGLAPEAFAARCISEELAMPRAVVALKTVVDQIVDRSFAAHYPQDVIARVFESLLRNHRRLRDDACRAWGKRRVHPDVASWVKARLDAEIVGRSGPLDQSVFGIGSCSLLAPKAAPSPTP